MFLPPILDCFPEVWAADFEFRPDANLLPIAVCGVFRELRSGREYRLWGEELRKPPPMRPDALYIAYLASAEMGCHLALGWSLPENLLDLYVEFRNFANGREVRLHLLGKGSRGQLSALAHFGLSHIDADSKHDWRERILAGPPYSAAERAGIIDYCAGDVDGLEALLPRLVGQLEHRPKWLDHALLRGRYMKAVARMERTGTPLDLEMLQRLRKHWLPIEIALVRKIINDFPVFTGTRIDQRKLMAFVAEHHIGWPRTPTGLLATDKETLKQLATAYPFLAPLREVKATLGKMILDDLQVGADGRNRVMLSPFGTKPGRNAPSTSKFIMGTSAWMRALIRPAPGRAIAYIDWLSQEIAIAAALSGDENLMNDYRSDDPYIRFAIAAGKAPNGATKKTHKPIRDQVKQVVLGTNYGMRARSVADKAGIFLCDALALLEAHREHYKVFWDWSQRAIEAGRIRGYLDTTFGWRLHIDSTTKATSLLNHPMQSNAAEMMRLAAILMTEDGINVCAPVHDAFVIEDSIENIEASVARARAHMLEAAHLVIPGFDVGTEHKIFAHPNRFMDEDRGRAVWADIQTLLHQCEEKSTNPSTADTPLPCSD